MRTAFLFVATIVLVALFWPLVVGLALAALAVLGVALALALGVAVLALLLVLGVTYPTLTAVLAGAIALWCAISWERCLARGAIRPVTGIGKRAG